ncbi:3-hydroxyacyl-[acyl-carrier-protein] dehydrataseFabZ [Buchnera aphidicola (Periphyllus testudinaceus)]|uniref:3-hydroxyacyl-ACP dehydratase FabZ n=1 Tax=Buchnera aphidicola TaxID=9 RepID=UPI0034649A72
MIILNKINFLKFIPHRKPFLFVDKIVKFKKKYYLHSKFKILPENLFFLGHFPKNPIFPGVLILESMMQSAGILFRISYPNILKKKINYLTSIKNAKFRKLVLPNDMLNIKIFFINLHNNFIKFKGFVLVNKFLVCEAIITIYIK